MAHMVASTEKSEEVPPPCTKDKFKSIKSIMKRRLSGCEQIRNIHEGGISDDNLYDTVINTSRRSTHLHTARRGSYAATRAVERASLDSSVIEIDRLQNNVPRFELDELTLGRLLGRGAFSEVYEIKSINVHSVESMKKIEAWDADESSFTLSSDEEEEEEENYQEEFRSKMFIASHCTSPKTHDARYVVKYLRSKIIKDETLLELGAADLALEAEFLSNLSHPNIIKIRGVSSDGLDGFDNPAAGGYFIILDRLYQTLDTKSTQWKKQLKPYRGFMGLFRDFRNRKKRELMATRLKCAFDLAAALKYLHERNLIYRDLKPQNIGFDIRGDVKLFDFGLVRELHARFKYSDGTYKLTPMTGTRRYMAPEVILGKPYNLKADIYSFSLILWELCAVKTVFLNYTFSKLKEMVVQHEHRPNLYFSWPMSLQTLLRNSWSRSISKRPTFDYINNVLKDIIIDYRHGNDTGLEHSRRRSTNIFN